MSDSPHPCDDNPIDLRLFHIETEALIDELSRRATLSLVVMMDEAHAAKGGSDAKYSFAFKGTHGDKERGIEVLRTSYKIAMEKLHS